MWWSGENAKMDSDNRPFESFLPLVSIGDLGKACNKRVEFAADTCVKAKTSKEALSVWWSMRSD
jgi:hypothetical protein